MSGYNLDDPETYFSAFFRQFINKKLNKTFYISEGLHKNYKAKVLLPPCLQCSYLTDKLFSTTHTILGHVYPLPIIKVR